MYWRTPDVRQITTINTFKEESSIYSFVSSAVGKNYDELTEYAIEYFDKKDNPKYFGQIISFINFLGLIELDEGSYGHVKANELLEDIYGRVTATHDFSLAKEYLDYYLSMWQFPTPNLNDNRQDSITKPYILIIRVLQGLYNRDPDEAYLSKKDFFRLFEHPSIRTIEDITHGYIDDIIKNRNTALALSQAVLNRKVSYYGALLSESYLLTFNPSDYGNSGDFMFGLKRNIDVNTHVGSIIRKYKDEYFIFDPDKNANDKEVLGHWSKWINDKEKFFYWRRQKMLIEDVGRFHDYCASKGFFYDKDLIRRFITSLDTKPFLILTGISGSGKTKIAELWADYRERTGDQKLHISVGSNWTDNKKLLGYKNIVMDDAYIKTKLVDIITEANSNEYEEFIVILDEMNLSHVERYFSDFLSALESLNHEILLPNNQKVYWKHNLKIIGTVNIDETTYMFSPKVLDRANVIEMNAVEPSKYIESVIDSENKVYTYLKDKVWFEKYLSIMDKLYSALGGKFGFRVIDEISQYLKINTDAFGDDVFSKSFDEQIMQKVLPKLHGSKAALKPRLNNLEETLGGEEGEYTLSLGKIKEMNEALKKGYASYIGD